MREPDLLEMAAAYREMADKSRDIKLKFEFSERAERYETVAWAVRRKSDPETG